MRALVAACVVVASSAFAHIKLLDPPSFQVTDAYGSPNKSEPCGGPGTATNAVTTVMAGSQLTVTWSEPILHPGHFRLGIATDPSAFVTPTAVLNNGNSNCASAPIESTPAYPTIVDGLFPHTSASPTGQWTTSITVPMMSCDNCTLQVMQFMSSHAPPCFYFQCAKLRIVMPADAGADDAGVVDAGVTDTGAPDAGSRSTDAGVEPPAMPAGCGCTSTPMLFALCLPLLLRRRGLG